MSNQRGLLIHTESGDQVDLFLINHEEVSIQNKISGDDNIDLSRLDKHVSMLPAEISLEGRLLPSGYDRSGRPIDEPKARTSSGDDIGSKPADKMETLIKFANDARPGTSFNLYAPSMPFKVYYDFYITDFTYSNEDSSNAIDFNLTLEEIGMYRKLDRGESTGNKGKNIGYFLKDKSIKFGSRYHASIASLTEDGGGQKEHGTPSVRSIDDVLTVESLEERVEEKEAQVIPKGSSKMELISRLIGSEEEMSDRTSILSVIGYPDLSIGEQFDGNNVSGDLGVALNQELEGISFPSTAKITDKRLDDMGIISNIPNVGNVLDAIKTRPRDSEFLVEANRDQKSTIMMTMNSAVMRKLRSYVIDIGADLSNGLSNRLKNNTILSGNENRILKQAFNNGINKMMMKSREYDGLGGFITTLPQKSKEDKLTYYNYYGQPMISFEGIVELNFDRWSTQYVTLNGEEYEFETYWNKRGFPVCSISQTDGTEITTQSRVFLGTDMLNGAQGVPNLEGVHIVPFSISDNKGIDQDEIGESVFFMIVHTNTSAINEVL